MAPSWARPTGVSSTRDDGRAVVLLDPRRPLIGLGARSGVGELGPQGLLGLPRLPPLPHDGRACGGDDERHDPLHACTPFDETFSIRTRPGDDRRRPLDDTGPSHPARTSRRRLAIRSGGRPSPGTSRCASPFRT